MKTLYLSGWSQSPESLADVVPEGALPFDYADFDSVETCFAALAAEQPDALIGWSLGGQLALRAVLEGAIAPQKLALIAAPFQIAATEQFSAATSKEALLASRAAFAADAKSMLRQFYTLCAMGDARQREIVAALRGGMASQEGKNWLFWFDELLEFSFYPVDFSVLHGHSPQIALIYGESDCIVPYAQAEALAERLPQASLHRFESCAHVPHLHDAARVRNILKGL